MDENILAFATEMVEEKFPGAEEKEGLIEIAAKGLTREIDEAIIAALPEEKLPEFQAWLDDENATEEGLAKIMEGIDEEKVVRKAMLEYKDFFMQEAQNGQ